VQDLIGRNVLTVMAACRHHRQVDARPGARRPDPDGVGRSMGGQPGVAAYSAAKAFVLNLAESLWSELRASSVDVIGIAAPIMETPSLRRSLGDKHIPGAVAAGDVARLARDRLPNGPCYLYAFGEPVEKLERQTIARRDRVLAVEKITQAFFGK
jgi:NAD(P)-dependent dehydrogenase (short-subunit alcohol dehydrogenase family)